MIRKVIDYIKEDEFEMKIDSKYINIINFIDIPFMEDEKIKINYKEGSILIKGKDLTVLKLLDKEILIKGNFLNIEFRRDYE